MDLRKGSEVKDGMRRCMRCSGRKQMYTAMGGWTHNNSGGLLKDCPLCLGKGVIDKVPAKIEIDETKIEELTDGKKRRKQRKTKENSSFEKEY